MAVTTVELNATQELASQPILWRLSKLFHVVTNMRRARITEDYAYISLQIEGSTQEVEQALDYLRAVGMLKDGKEASSPAASTKPEAAISQPNTIYVQLRTVNPQQGHSPTIYRVGKDFEAVVTVEKAAFDEEEGGSIDISISGPLQEVQRAIAYLHTTGIRVNPHQRSVTDFGNL